MKNAIFSTLYHCMSSDKEPKHMKCPGGESSWCFYNKSIARGKEPPKHDSTTMSTILTPFVVSKIVPVYARLSSSELLQRCTKGKTQNANECLHSVIWSKCPKEIFISKKKLDIAVTSAISEFNMGCEVSVKLRGSVAGLDLSDSAVKVNVARDKRRINISQNTSNPGHRTARKRLRFTKMVSEQQKKRVEGVAYGSRQFLMQWLVVLCVVQLTLGCIREPHEEHSTALRSPGDNGFRIQISGEPERYVPGAVYTLSLVGSRTHGRLQQFTRFMLTAEPLDPHLGIIPGVDASPRRVGSFQLFGDSLTTFNENCINTISEADDLPKTEIQVMWISPPKGSGCVMFRAMVLEDADNWYADDGGLSRQLCEFVEPRKGKSDDDEGECCACDEAKYQLIFEGIWSNVTHPKDFPFSLWLTHFSDVIGASHERNFSFWGEGQYSSDGLRQVAEWGSVRGMEAELRAESKHLRTLIKAAGLWYPRVNENTTSSFRVDQRHPLVSLVSMLGPTPDWIVGVPSLNLCNRDCTWVDQKILDLFPWDAGTDSGITYMSPNSPTVPQEKIHRITTMYPEDPRAPFYDPTGKPMAPLARLYLTRESVIPKSCDEQSLGRILEESLQVAENTEDSSRPECAVTEYSDWSPCSVSCGKGLRMRRRFYRNEGKAAMLGCDRQLISKEMCVAEVPECPGGEESALPVIGGDEQILEDNEGICATTPWGLWSECSVSCGEGVMFRNRRFVERLGRKRCPHVILSEKKPCTQPECGIEEPTREIVDPMCPATEWSDWSPCSASCGKGVKLRTRLLLVAPELQQKCSMRVELVQQRHCIVQEDCTFDMAQAKEICMMEQEIGPCRGYFERWYFEPRKGMCVPFGYGGCRGNRNNFLTAKECNDACGIIRDQLLQQLEPPRLEQQRQPPAALPLPVDCVVSDWSVWTDCSATCGIGVRERFRMIKVKSENGGRPCPRRLVRRKKCQIAPCEF